MNRRPPGLKLEKTIQGFLQCKAAAGLSKRTIESYASDLRMWLEYLGGYGDRQDHPSGIAPILELHVERIPAASTDRE